MVIAPVATMVIAPIATMAIAPNATMVIAPNNTMVVYVILLDGMHPLKQGFTGCRDRN